ncbi:SDR family oxidoreductase [Neobacillus sp. 179-J 1A1 HS]|uniref:SDR family oxidoreductase n=1 Tax=Neobacillus driksii TaxID=3035913 RepID=UPI0035BC947F
MKILVLGGSRFLGRKFVEEAQRQNHEITIFNRGNQNEGFKEVEIITGDRLNDLSKLKNRYWDAVLDTSGFIPSSVLKSTELLKDRVKHYTFISSISVYKDWVQENFDETYPVYDMSLEKANELAKDSNIYEYYGQFKALCEVVAEKAMPGRVANIRAGQLIGPNDYTDRIPYWIHRIAAGGRILAPGNPNRPVQIIDNKDLAHWILSMMANQTAGTFNATGPDYTLTMKEFLAACMKVTGTESEIVWASEKFLLENKVAPWTEMPLWVPEEFPLEPELKDPWRGAFTVNIDKAIASGLTFRPLKESLTEIYEWEKQRNLASDEWKSGMSADREKELLELWFQQTSK